MVVAFLELSLASAVSATGRSPRVIDISLDSACSSTAVGSAVTLSDSSCWRHTHPDEYKVYDFSFWTVAHPGNVFAFAENRANPITAFALEGSATLSFPSWHPISRWETGKGDLTYLGNLGDDVDFAELPANSQSTAMANLVGSIGAAGATGYETCGSPFEVANDPLYGQRWVPDFF